MNLIEDSLAKIHYFAQLSDNSISLYLKSYRKMKKKRGVYRIIRDKVPLQTALSDFR